MRVTDRSKTEDIVNCTPDIAELGSSPATSWTPIARAIGQPVFKKVDVVVQTNVGEPFPEGDD